MNKVSLTLAVASATAILAFTGCSSIKGAPQQSYKTRDQIKKLSQGFDESATISKYNSAATDDLKRSIRNEYVTQRLTLIDLNYQHWIHSEAFNRQVWDTATALAILGVDAAGTLVGATETKTILHAVSGGITGSTLAVDKNFFYDKTVPALAAAMDAERKKALNPIVNGLQTDKVEGKDSYSLAQAVIDLNAYYLAGTFLGALNGVQKTAAVETANVSEVNRTVKLTPAEIRKLDTNTLIRLNQTIYRNNLQPLRLE